jgi:hypothetical protein
VEATSIPTTHIGGLAGGAETSAFVNIDLELTSTGGHTFHIPAEVHVIENLSYNLLLGVNILKSNSAVIDLKNDLIRFINT